jgi:hypothetical protein
MYHNGLARGLHEAVKVLIAAHISATPSCVRRRSCTTLYATVLRTSRLILVKMRNTPPPTHRRHISHAHDAGTISATYT